GGGRQPGAEELESAGGEGRGRGGARGRAARGDERDHGRARAPRGAAARHAGDARPRLEGDPRGASRLGAGSMEPTAVYRRPSKPVAPALGLPIPPPRVPYLA